MENPEVADRLVKTWGNMTKIVRFWEKLPKSNQPLCKSVLSVQSAVNDKLAAAKLQFFSFVVSLFKSFLTESQND